MDTSAKKIILYGIELSFTAPFHYFFSLCRAFISRPLQSMEFAQFSSERKNFIPPVFSLSTIRIRTPQLGILLLSLAIENMHTKIIIEVNEFDSLCILK